MKKMVFLFVMSSGFLLGCMTTTDISGTEFSEKIEHRRRGEKVVLRRDDRAGFFYADWYIMPPMKSVFEFEKTLRTSTNELSVERFEALKKQIAEDDARSPFPY